jgi:Tol biopolymer transport system component
VGGAAQSAPVEALLQQVLFTRGSDLHVVRTDGSQPRKLVSDAKQAAVSPNGRQIAFVRDESIWVVNPDGFVPRRLTSAEDDVGPAWSPDGETLYFSRRIAGKDKQGGYVYAFALFRMASGGGGVKQLTYPELEDHGICHQSPAPSPDGQLVAFADFYTDCDHGWANAIAAIDRRGRNVSLDEFNVDSGFDPAWSPDGSLLAFAATDDDFGEPIGIRLASPSGAPATEAYAGWSSGPAWSPDGEWIALQAEGEIWLVRRDGTELHKLTSSAAEERDPVWLPSQS